MKDILEEIVENKRVELAIAQGEMDLAYLKELTAEKIARDGALKLRSMKQSLAQSKSGIIAEFKRKSPSKGWIHADVEPEGVVPFYAAGGASAVSILTDEKYFGGKLDFIQRARTALSDDSSPAGVAGMGLPILRKEFIIDEYQLYEARLVGADAVLLIAADLFPQQYADLCAKAHELGLEVLFEVHDPAELSYLEAAIPDMLGVNNRSLGTFHTDVQHSFDMATLLTSLKGKEFAGKILDDENMPLLVSESGISNPKIVQELRKVGFRGFLIGECFMKEANPGAALAGFITDILASES